MRCCQSELVACLLSQILRWVCVCLLTFCSGSKLQEGHLSSAQLLQRATPRDRFTIFNIVVTAVLAVSSGVQDPYTAQKESTFTGCSSCACYVAS